MMAATRGPASLLPTCTQFFRPSATGRIAFSARLHYFQCGIGPTIPVGLPPGQFHHDKSVALLCFNLADAPPFELAKANSNNHGKAGQNVLYADGHVAFQATAYCGVGTSDLRDNIYTALSPIPVVPGNRPPPYTNGFYGRDVGPSWMYDSYLVPTDDE